MNGNIQVYGERNPKVPLHPAVQAGDFVFVSGQVPRNEEGVLCAGSIEEATRVTLEAVRRVLLIAGCTLDDVVSVTCYLVDRRDFSAFNEVFKEFFPEGRIARSTVEASPVIDCKVEIDCIAYKPVTRLTERS